MHAFIKLHNMFFINIFFSCNYTEAQSCLHLPVFTELVNKGQSVTQSKKYMFTKTKYYEALELMFLSFLFQVSENEEEKWKVIV